MASIVIDGVRMDWPRRCKTCGRKPEVSTGYKDFEPGFGPFVIKCMHGLGGIMEQYEKVQRGEFDRERWQFARSWSKTRAVRNWNAMQSAPGRPNDSGGTQAEEARA